MKYKMTCLPDIWISWSLTQLILVYTRSVIISSVMVSFPSLCIAPISFRPDIPKLLLSSSTGALWTETWGGLVWASHGVCLCVTWGLVVCHVGFVCVSRGVSLSVIWFTLKISVIFTGRISTLWKRVRIKFELGPSKLNRIDSSSNCY